MQISVFLPQNRLSLPFWITVTVELLCVAFFLFRFLHELTFTRREGFWRDAKHVVAMAIILLTVFDIAVSTVLHEVGLQYYRWSRPLRPFILVNLPEGRQIRQGFRNIRRTLPDIRKRESNRVQGDHGGLTLG